MLVSGVGHGARAQDFAQTAAPPVLREQIAVMGGLVRLGDLFDNAGDASNIAVFRAPDLGQTGTVGADRIAQAARTHGLAWTNPGEIRSVVVARPARRISLDDVADAIRRKLASSGYGTIENLQVDFAPGARPIRLDPRIQGAVTVKYLDHSRASGAFRAVIAIAGARDEPDRTYAGRALEMADVAVPLADLARGAVIAAGDVETVKIPKTRLPGGIAMLPGHLVGLAAKRNLQKGRPVRLEDLEPPKIVKRNTLVTMIYEAPGISVKSQGKAMDDGARNEAVSVLNTRSNRLIQAVVRGPGVVTVKPHARPGAQASARGTATTAQSSHLVR